MVVAVDETSSVVTNSAHRSGRAKLEGMMANFSKSEMQQGALDLLSVLCIADSVAVVVSTSVVSKDEQQRGW